MAWSPPPAQDAPTSAQGPAVPEIPPWLRSVAITPPSDGLASWRTAAPELAGNPAPAAAPVPLVPYAPPTTAPQAPAVPSARPLATPVWERQPDEPAVAWHAFQGWLAPGAGGTVPGTLPGSGTGNWAEAGAWIAESRRDVLEAMAVEWSWEARRAAQDAAKAAKAPAAEVRAQRAEARRLQAIVTDCAILEWAKLKREIQDTPAMRLGVKEAIALFGRVAGVEVMRERAGILESLSAGANNAPAINWDNLTDDELEAYRTLRDKAGV